MMDFPEMILEDLGGVIPENSFYYWSKLDALQLLEEMSGRQFDGDISSAIEWLTAYIAVRQDNEAAIQQPEPRIYRIVKSAPGYRDQNIFSVRMYSDKTQRKMSFLGTMTSTDGLPYFNSLENARAAIPSTARRIHKDLIEGEQIENWEVPSPENDV